MEVTKIASSGAIGHKALARQTELLRERLGAVMRLADEMAEVPVTRGPANQVSDRDVRALLKLRRNRDRHFDAELFADPAWDILLELYASALGQYRVSVSNLCHGAAVPATTALRWIKQLEEKGLICRRPDPTDGRRCFLMLSHEGLEAMNAYFRTVPAGFPLI